MPLARAGVRTESTTRYSYNARRGQLPRTRIGIVHRTRARHAVCAEGLHFSAFHIKRFFALNVFVLTRFHHNYVNLHLVSVCRRDAVVEGPEVRAGHDEIHVMIRVIIFLEI